MSKILSKLSLIIAAVALVLSSCSKDDDDNDSPGNPVNGNITAVFNSTVTYGTMTDQDSNVYKTVTIGTQTWMAENLRTTKYNDGTAIPLVTDPTAWGNLTTDAYCNYGNTNNTDTIATFGRLYNWHAVNTGKLAPTGWHVPTDAEWTQLTDYLGGTGVAGGKLKEIGTTHWTSPNTGATNETGFTALPVGTRSNSGEFGDIGYGGVWWSATEDYADYALFRFVGYAYSNVGRLGTHKEIGLSVRCLRD